MIKQQFENKKYNSYPQNAYSGDLPIEYKQRLITKLPIYRLDNNQVERLKFSLIKQSLDNRRYRSNHRNANFYDLPYDGD